MTRWKRIEELFEAAIEMPVPDRDDYLARTCADDVELRDEVASLLASANGAGPSLRAAIAVALEGFTADTNVALIGRRLGVYRIERSLGEGGMGAVYLAARDDDEYHARVAIKVLHHGGAHAVARFRDERQILASLDHPSIVRLLDGGTTDDGTPYLVMDYIDGVPLTRYVEAHGSSIRERLTLFRTVCAPVQYAHQQLIVHRDLKPSNILVDHEGSPRLLDFGIAKLLDAARADTVTMPMLTPEYASPEQARGEHVSTATDVYSLGAVLYELLCNKPPVLRTVDSLEQLRRICDDEPARPSAVAPRADRAALAGDLDNIVLKALHKDPTRRYASVEQLSDDVGRHLAGLPVRARPATFGYRAQKLIRRNRGKLVAATLATIALAGATVFSITQARRADDQARRAERRLGEMRGLASSLLFEIDAKIRDLPGANEARELVVTRARQYLDRLARDSDGDANIERELAIAYMKVGDIEGNMYEPNLGRATDALASYDRARVLLDLTPATDLDTRIANATWLFGMSCLHQTTGDLERARIEAASAIEATSHLDPQMLDRTTVMRGHAAAAELDLLTGHLVGAQADGDRFLAVAQRWFGLSQDREGRYWLAVANELNGRIEDLLGDPPRAIARLVVATAELARLADEYPDDARFGREDSTARTVLAGAYGGIGDKYDWSPGTGQLELAEQEEQRGVDRAELTRDPMHDTRAVIEHGAFVEMLAGTIALRDRARAVPVFDHALAIWDSVPAAARAEHYSVQLEWFVHCAAAESYAVIGRRDAAVTEIDRGLALLATVPADTVQDETLQCKYLVARARHVLGDDARAGKLAEDVLAELDKRVAAKSYDVSYYIGAVDDLELLALVHPKAACAARRRAAATWRAWPGPSTSYIRDRAAALDAAANACGS